MDRPDAAVVRGLSKVDLEARGYGEDSAFEPLVAQANAYLEQVTWRPLATMPAELEPIALQVVRMRAEQLVFLAQEEYVETVTDDAVASFSAGPYSETRTDRTKPAGKFLINSWPALNEALWLLLGGMPGEDNALVEQRREYWLGLLAGVNAPAWGVTEVDWSAPDAMGLANTLGPVNPGLDFYPHD